MATQHVATEVLRDQLLRSVQEASVTNQLDKLEAVIAVAQAARVAASRGLLFCSRSGAALMDAISDLTEVDGMFSLAGDVRREIGI